MTGIRVEKVHQYTGHKDCLYTLEKAGKPNEFFSSGGDGMVVKWDLDNQDQGKLMAKVDASVYALNYDQETDVLVVGQNFEGIHLISVEDRSVIGSVKTGDPAIFDIKKYQDRLLVALANGMVKVIHANDLTTLADLNYSRESARCIAIHEEEREFAVGYSDHLIRIFDLDSYALKHELSSHLNSVFTVGYIPDTSVLVSGSRDARLKFWDGGKNYELLESVNAHMYAINHLVFSPDNNYFVSCSMDKSIKVWDARSFQLLKVIDKSRHAGHGTSVNKLLWSTYHDQIVACSDDHSISVWKLNF